MTDATTAADGGAPPGTTSPTGVSPTSTSGTFGSVPAPPATRGADAAPPAEVAARGPGTEVRSKQRTLDLLRALAALGVVVFHYRAIAEREGVPIRGAEVGDVGVQVFFVLSGFLIATSVIAPPVLSRRDYVLNRAFRILPLAWFAVVVVIAVDGRRVLDEANPLGDLVSHALLLHGLFPDFRTSIIGPLWTLSIEWQFYLFVLVVAGLLRHHRARWVVVAAMVAGGLLYRAWVWNRYATPGDLNLYTKQLPGVIDQFAVGVLAALAVRSARVRRFLSRPAVAFGGLVAAAATTFGLLVVYSDNTPGRPGFAYWKSAGMVVLWPLAFAASIAVVVLLIQQHEERLGPWIRWSGLGYVGLISYSVYVFHLQGIADTPQVLGWFGLEASGWARVAATLAVVLLGASASYFLVERTAMQVRRRLRSRSSGPGPSSGSGSTVAPVRPARPPAPGR